MSFDEWAKENALDTTKLPHGGYRSMVTHFAHKGWVRTDEFAISLNEFRDTHPEATLEHMDFRALAFQFNRAHKQESSAECDKECQRSFHHTGGRHRTDCRVSIKAEETAGDEK